MVVELACPTEWAEMHVLPHAATFRAMDRETAEYGSTSATPAVRHPTAAPRDLAPDSDLVASRLRRARPLATLSPHPGPNPSALRRDVLYALRTGGPSAPDQIAEKIGASRTGVLQQLRTLETAGLVTRTVVRHGVGRPRHLYDLAPGAQELFPTNYGALAEAVLEAVRGIGGDDLVERVFDARRAALGERLRARLAERLPQNASLWERVQEVAAYQDESGYLGRAMRGEDGTIRLCEYNCAIAAISGGNQEACAAEMRLLGDLLRARVTRETHIPAGARSCTYRVEPASD